MLLSPISDDGATADQAQALAQMRAVWGAIPRLGRVLAISPQLTDAALAFGAALSEGLFDARTREQIAIAVANENRCSYCLAAHSAAARAAGVSDEDISLARSGRAGDPTVAAALTFAQAVVRERGFVEERQLVALRAAGLNDRHVVELVGHAIANSLNNYLHHLSGVRAEFPAVPFAGAPADRQVA